LLSWPGGPGSTMGAGEALWAEAGAVTMKQAQQDRAKD
jgi:hypothetical protein